MATPRFTAKARLARAVRALRELHADGFTVDVIADIAVGDRLRPISAEERAAVRDLYIAELPPRLRPDAR